MPAARQRSSSPASALAVTATTGAAGCSSTFGEGSYTLFTYTGTATGSFNLNEAADSVRVDVLGPAGELLAHYPLTQHWLHACVNRPALVRLRTAA